MEEILRDERKYSGSNSHGLQPDHVHISLRAFVDDQTVKVPRLLSEKVERLLSILFRSTKTEFTPTKTLRWNINDDPAGGVVAVGLALWGPEPDFFYRIGEKNFWRNSEMMKSSMPTASNLKHSNVFSRRHRPGAT